MYEALLASERDTIKSSERKIAIRTYIYIVRYVKKNHTKTYLAVIASICYTHLNSQWSGHQVSITRLTTVQGIS